MIIRQLSRVVCLWLAVSTAVQAEALKEDNVHVRTWNQFAQDALALHRSLIQTLPVTKKTSTGGYAHLPDFYKEESYYHNGKLVSRVQWEVAKPDNLHVIEVFVRDEGGRVIRDYTAAYLPEYRNAPTQTLISLHQYNGELHAFRSFDASGDRINERCTGKLNGKSVNLLLDEDEIYAALDGDSDLMQSAEYRACFAGLAEEAGKYLTPH